MTIDLVLESQQNVIVITLVKVTPLIYCSGVYSIFVLITTSSNGLATAENLDLPRLWTGTY
jgi:hypothetical protein